MLMVAATVMMALMIDYDDNDEDCDDGDERDDDNDGADNEDADYEVAVAADAAESSSVVSILTVIDHNAGADDCLTVTFDMATYRYDVDYVHDDYADEDVERSLVIDNKHLH